MTGPAGVRGSRWVGLTSDSPNKYTAQYLRKMKAEGFRPMLITWARHRRSLKKRLGASYALLGPESVVFIKHLDDPASAASVLARALRVRQIELVNWINVPDPLTDTFLYSCGKLGLKFPFLRPYSRCRVKPLARTIVRKKMGSRLGFSVLNRGASRVPRSVKYPSVCKPITGSGSRDVQIVAAREKLIRYGRRHRKVARAQYVIEGYSPVEQYLAEEHLEGLEIEVDGYVYAGEPRICALGYKSHEYKKSAFRETAGVTYRPFTLRGRHGSDRRAIAWTTKLLRALEFTAGCFHLEAMETRSGLELIEINPRPGGGGVQPIVKKLSGVSLGDECVRLWLGLEPDREPAVRKISCISYFVLYPDKKGILRSIRSEESVDLLLDGQRIRGRWFQLVGKGTKFSLDKEEYLGELHIENVALDPSRLPELSKQVARELRARGFWQIRASKP